MGIKQSDKQNRSGFSLIIICSILSFISFPISAKELVVKAGLWDARPIQYIDESNNAKGIFPEIINKVALQEGWQVEYIPLSFTEGMRQLTKGEIDLMSSVAYSPKRTSDLSFTHETVITTFARIYTRKNIEINSILDLADMRIAVPKNGMLYVGPGGIKDLLKGFNVQCTFLEKDTFEEVMQSVAEGHADAGVASRLTGNKFEAILGLKRTPIVFRPLQLRIAFPKNGVHTSKLQVSIDQAIKKMKPDEGSVLNKALAQLFGAGIPTRKVIPLWLIIAFLVIIGSLGVVLVFLAILRRQIRKRTQALTNSESRWRSLTETSPDHILTLDTSLNVQFANFAAPGLTVKELIGTPLYQYIEGKEKQNEVKAILEDVLRTGEEKSYETVYHIPDGGTIHYESTAVPRMLEGSEGFIGLTISSRNITERKQAEEKIKASLKEKQILIDEIHHRVKNNMNVVSSLLKLQTKNIEDEKTKDILKDSQSRIYAMSAIYETIHGSENLSEISLKKYLYKITNSIFQSSAVNSKIVKIKNDITEMPISINQASPLGLIINELISNSLKYAFPEERKGQISVSMKKLDKQTELIVSDNGIGISPNLDWKNTNTLGLKLVRTLVENQLDGTIDMESTNGTKFIIKFNIET